MKIVCEVSTQNRLVAGNGGRSQARSTRASVVLGKKNVKSEENKPGSIFLLVCTAKDKTGTKYRVQGNINTVFSKFVHEGKATIRFKEPPFDLCISKADPGALKKLLTVLRLDEKQVQNSSLSTLAPVKASEIERPKTELIIKHRKDYPVSKPFPASLQKLTISNCMLKRFDPRIFFLKHLDSLNMTGNSLTALPRSFLRLQALSQLHLPDNKITEFPPCLCDSAMGSNLKALDLSGNQIHLLPVSFCKMKKLVSLKLDSNGLLELPPSIGELKSMRYFSASKNMLRTIPSSVRELHLECVDLSGNPYLRPEECEIISQIKPVLPLIELAGRSVKKIRYPTRPDVIPRNLLKYLRAGKRCAGCQGYCWGSYANVIEWISLHQLSHTVISGSVGSNTSTIPADAFLCSNKCLQKWKQSRF